MMQIDANITYPKLDGLSYGELLRILRFHMAEIGDPVLKNIENRTPKLTGALREDEDWKPLGGQGGLLQWYVGDTWQLAEWGRVYAKYQEGPPLGTTGYTRGPWQMFEKVATDDLPAIEQWALDTVQDAVDNLFSPLP